ncbi:MAG: hypothetical protein CMJ83_15865 [Planctomycetes bacterium]|nr:hypothetical protein [Planctomycetota bacterium]
MHPHFGALSLVLAMVTSGLSAQSSARKARAELETAEKTILGASATSERTTRAAAYVTRSMAEADLESVFPPSTIEHAILEVLRDHVAGEGVELQARIGHHVLILAPPGWLAAIEPRRLRANLDAAMILLHDLTGCSVEAARARRIVVMFSPGQPAERAQTLGAVVRFGKRWLVTPPPWTMLFHELGHEMFPGSIRPRFETFNEAWPHIGRQYIYQHLGMAAPFEHDRGVFRDALEMQYLRPKLTLDQLGPYNIGAGAIDRIFETATLRAGVYDWSPVKRLFRAAAAIPSETGSFHHRQEVLAWLISEHLGGKALETAEALGFSLLPSRRAVIGRGIERAAPLHARAMAALGGSDSARGRVDLQTLVSKFPGSMWAADAAIQLAAHHHTQARPEKARTSLESAGFLLDWHVVGPFDNRNRGGLRRPYGPEQDAQLETGYAGAIAQVKWRPITASLATGRVDLDAVMKPNDGVVAYLRATVHSGRDCDAVLLTGSDDGIAIWVNGHKVLHKDVYRGLMLDSDRARCRLKKGRNTLLLKVSEGGQAWEACCRLTLPDGNPIPRRELR